MLFDFLSFIEELRDNPDKQETVEKYEDNFGPIKGDLKDQVFFKDYVSKFEITSYNVPDGLTNDFDWNLALQLVAASFSSEYAIKDNELFIHVKSASAVTTKTMSELWSFQVLRLFEIYVEEQMNLTNLLCEDETEKKAIITERDIRLAKWAAVLKDMKYENCRIAAKEFKRINNEILGIV